VEHLLIIIGEKSMMDEAEQEAYCISEVDMRGGT
jgi:hypothetical protein